MGTRNLTSSFWVLLLKIAHPSHIHTHVLASDCKMVHISVNGRSYIYNEKTLLSSATYVFIKNSANGSETAISICNAVNNSTTLPAIPHTTSRPNRPSLHHAHAKRKSEVRLSNYCHNLSWPFSERYLGPLQFFFALILSDAAAAVSHLSTLQRRGTMVANRWRIWCILHNSALRRRLCVYIYIYMFACMCVWCVCTHTYGGGTRGENIT